MVVNHVVMNVVLMNNIEEIKKYALENRVPILQDAGLSFLLETIKKYKVKTVLEIGTAIAYTSINLALNNVLVTTIERDETMYQKAKENVANLGLSDKINLIYGDALEVSKDIKGIYDLIFIDAAKAQYEKFFNLYLPYLSEDGIIVCDNLDFHGLVDKEDLSNYSRSLRSLIKKIRNFKSFLSSNEQFETTFYNVGDGMSISIRKK